MINEKMYKLGSKRSVIREIFEYAEKARRGVGAENVFDFSIGNPSVPAPACVEEAILRIVRETPSVRLHGYTSARATRIAATGRRQPQRPFWSGLRATISIDLRPPRPV